jgi:hypothetical protein
VTTTLHGSHLETYEAISRHPAAHNLGWRDVRSMLVELAAVTEEPNGNLKVIRNGQTLIIHAHREKDVAEMRELMQLRHFLERSSGEKAPAADGAGHLLVVIDHREARVYQTELHGAQPQRIKPYDPQGSGRHLHYVQDDSNGQRRPESGSFYSDVVKALSGAEKILLFGTGTGASSAMDGLMAEFKLHHKALAARVIGAEVVDETHLSEDQLLAKARKIYAAQPQATNIASAEVPSSHNMA